MISAFSFCFILYSKAKFACYSRCFFTSYFCIPVPYNEKDIFLGCQFQKVLQVFLEPLNFSFCTGQGIDLDYCDIECYLPTNYFLKYRDEKCYRADLSFSSKNIGYQRLYTSGVQNFEFEGRFQILEFSMAHLKELNGTHCFTIQCHHC